MASARSVEAVDYSTCNPDAVRWSSADPGLGLGWRGVTVNQDRFEPFDRPDLCYTEHHVCINVGRPARLTHAHGRRQFRGGGGRDQFIVMPAGQPFRWKLETAAHALSIRLRPEFVSDLAAREGMNPDKVELVYHIPVRDGHVTAIGRLLLDEGRQGGPTGQLFADTQAAALALRLLHGYSSRPPRADPRRRLPAARLDGVKDYIRERAAQGLSLSDLADRAGMSLSHFVRGFTARVGLPPHRYLIQQRIKLAKEMLAAGTRGVGDIANAVGFKDQSHLNRHFKREVGVTPTAYRQARG